MKQLMTEWRNHKQYLEFESLLTEQNLNENLGSIFKQAVNIIQRDTKQGGRAIKRLLSASKAPIVQKAAAALVLFMVATAGSTAQADEVNSIVDLMGDKTVVQQTFEGDNPFIKNLPKVAQQFVTKRQRQSEPGGTWPAQGGDDIEMGKPLPPTKITSTKQDHTIQKTQKNGARSTQNTYKSDTTTGPDKYGNYWSMDQNGNYTQIPLSKAQEMGITIDSDKK